MQFGLSSRVLVVAAILATCTPFVTPLRAQPPAKPAPKPTGIAPASAEPPLASPAIPDYRGLSVAPPKEVAAEEKIRVALGTPIKVDFDKLPLNTALQRLEQQLKINLVIDQKSFSEAGIDVATPVTLKFDQTVPARTALQALLGPLELSWIMRDEVTLIVASHLRDWTLTTRTYPIRDLVTVKVGKEQIADYDRLRNAISTAVMPLSWESAGGSGGISLLPACGAMTLVSTSDVHEATVTLLILLHKARLLQQIPLPDAPVPPPGAPAKPLDPRTLRGILSDTEQAWQDKYNKALEKPLTLHLKDEPLSKFCAIVSKELGIPLHLDRKALAEAAVDPETPITTNLTAITARNVLRLILTNLELTFVPRDGLILITSRQHADTSSITRVYPVADLLIDTQGDARKLDPQDLMQMVKYVLAPASWDTAGGHGTIELLGPSGVFLIRNSGKVLDQIDPLLLNLRESRALQKIQPPTSNEYVNAYLKYRQLELKAQEKPTQTDKLPATPFGARTN